MEPDPVLVALWKKVADHWDDESAHAAFLRYCQDTEQLAQAAARYASARGDEARAAKAQKKLDAVGILATSALLATETERRRGLPRWATALAGALFIALAAYALFRALG